MNPQQKAFVDVLHSETGTPRAHAVTLTETLSDLAAKHKRLCHIGLDAGLTAEQDRARDAIESELRAATSDLKGVTRVSFNYDPRGLTVAIKFDSGVYDTWTDGGTMGVPVDPPLEIVDHSLITKVAPVVNHQFHTLAFLKSDWVLVR